MARRPAATFSSSSGLMATLVCAVGAAALVAACDDDASVAAPDAHAEADASSPDAPLDDAMEGGDAALPSYDWNLPPGFPVPIVPPDNPMRPEKVALGRRLFYDKRLSKNETQSCASCHRQELAFTDGLAHGVGSTGAEHPRSSMSLANVAYAPSLTWANPLLLTLERQAQVPLFGEDPVELGHTSTPEVEARLAAEPIYVELFSKAFPGEAAPINLANALKALASFQRTLISGRSPFDRWTRDGDETALSDSAKRGSALFQSEKFECFHCHGAPLFTDHATWVGKPFTDRPYHNTGLYNVDGAGAYPSPNTGVEAISKDPRDMGRFKAPSLRNIAVTAPYMHDGSIATLEEVLDHYVAGGRASSPLKDPIIVPLTVTAEERADLIEFLKSLTDQEFLTNPAFSNPWTRP